MLRSPVGVPSEEKLTVIEVLPILDMPSSAYLTLPNGYRSYEVLPPRLATSFRDYYPNRLRRLIFRIYA